MKKNKKTSLLLVPPYGDEDMLSQLMTTGLRAITTAKKKERRQIFIAGHIR